MAMKKEDIKKLYQDTFEKISDSPQNWSSFLDTASNIYRYEFSDQLMIYAQRPDAVACATFKTWSDNMGRKIKYGSKGIALYGKSDKITYLFDESDTVRLDASKNLNLWQLRNEHKKDVIALFETMSGRLLEGKEFKEKFLDYIDQVVAKEYDSVSEELQKRNIDDDKARNIKFLSETAGYLVLKRCGYGKSELEDSFHFEDVEELSADGVLTCVGAIANHISAQILQEIRDVVRVYDKEHFHEQKSVFEQYLNTAREELLSFNAGLDKPKEIVVNIDERGHDYFLVFKADDVFVGERKRTQENEKLISLSTAPFDIQMELLNFSGKYQEKINSMKNIIEEERSRDDDRNQTQMGERGIASGLSGNGAGERTEEVRSDERAISSGENEGNVLRTENEHGTDGALVGDSDSGRGAGREIGDRAYGSGESDGRVENGESAAVDSEDGAHTEDSRGDSDRNNYSQLSLFGNEKPVVAIETTEDYSEPDIGFYTFHYRDGREGIRYRLVTLNEEGLLTPYPERNKFFIEKYLFDEYIEAHKEDIVLTDYDSLVHQSMKKKTELHQDKTLHKSEEVMSKVPTIKCEWSEHPAFEDGKTYSVLEFDNLMKQLDEEWVQKREEAVKRCGSEEACCYSDNKEDYAYIGYAKTKFIVNLPNGDKITERQDIGDGIGGVIDYFKSYPQFAYIARMLELTKQIEELEKGQQDITDIPITTKEASKNVTEEQKPIKEPEQLSNFSITEEIGTGTDKEKYRANIEAIKTLLTIEKEGRSATQEEKSVLARYVGWGGLSDAFDSDKENWHKEYEELKELLTDEEYRNARASTRSAFFTSPLIAREIYETLGKMGFEGGNVLEPSMGTGNFFGSMPASMEQSSRLYGVELDSLTGRIAKQLYPKANINITGFEKTDFPDNFFDVVVGNVPFDEIKVNDKAYNKNNFLIHDYFIAKSIDKVRTGGVVAVITSKGSMDKVSEDVRKYINEKAEFLGAVRLPNTAFKKNAGTDVTSDILFFKKREAPVIEDLEWLHVTEKTDGMIINEYFDKHPEMIVGKMEMVSGRYGMVSTCVPDTQRPFEEQLRDALSHIKGEISPPEYTHDIDGNGKIDVDADVETIPAVPSVRNYSYAILDDKLYFRENSIMRTLNAKEEKNTERIRGMCEIRDVTRRLLDIQLDESVSESDIVKFREELNKKYDSYVEKYGALNSRGNKLAFQNDSSYNLLASLEKLDNDGNVEAKADIFTKRTVRIVKAVEHTDDVKDALAVSLGEKAQIDLEFIQKLTGKPEDEIISELTGIIYKNPLNGNWETAEEYLSGNVREKLSLAKEFASDDSTYNINVEALEKSIPADLSASEIDARIGSTWIEPKYIKDFMVEVLNAPQRAFDNGTMSVTYTPYGSSWGIKGKGYCFNNIKAQEVFGTKRINGYAILEQSLNLKEVQIYDTIRTSDGKEERRLNQADTIEAQAKQSELKEAFKEWIWKDPDRRRELVRKYNDTFNSIVSRHFDGSHLNFPAMSPAIELRQHQKDAVARILYGENTLLAHCVGAGKTFTMAAAAMESKRIGLCNKSLFVVPNHLTEQWGSEFLQLYPNAKILVATKKDFEPANRKKFCSRIATGDYDAVIIGHSQFERIPLSIERQKASIEKQIDELVEELENTKRSDGDKMTVKSLEKTRKSLEVRLEKLNDVTKKDDVVTFEQLGVDRLFVDESHNYKNLYVYTKMTNVAGIGSSESAKASDMYAKCQYMDEITNGTGITFATGTPIANTMAELYTNMRYLQSSLLKKVGISSFDAWASTFGETKTSMELKPEGTGYRMKTRFAKFFNIPELVNMWKESADIQTPDMLKLPVPEVEQHNVVLKPSEEQRRMVQELGDRADAVRNRLVDSTEDNMLKITGDGRKLALDQRIIDDMLPEDEDSKVNACVKEAFKIWEDTKAQKSTQLIFCDIATPKKLNENTYMVLKRSDDKYTSVYEQKLGVRDNPENIYKKLSGSKKPKDYPDESFDEGDVIVITKVEASEKMAYRTAFELKEGKMQEVTSGDIWNELGMAREESFASEAKFSVYTDIKKKLIDKGVPEKEIAFIHDANTDNEKKKLFKKVNSGSVRFLLGSTSKMGAGTNVQERLVALHHLDVPWRPDELEQQEGRIIRQGNQNDKVHIYRYIKEDTFDGYSWQTIENKQRFISQIMTSKSPVRSAEDIDETVLNDAQIKALCISDSRIKEKMDLDVDVQKLKILKDRHMSNIHSLEDKISGEYPRSIAINENRLAGLQEDIKKYDEMKASMPDDFVIKVADTTFTDKKEGAKAFLQAVSNSLKVGADKHIGSYMGFSMTTEYDFHFQQVYIVLHGATEHRCELGKDAYGNLTRINNMLNGMSNEVEEVKGRLEALKSSFEDAKVEVTKTFAHEDELKEKLARLAVLNAELSNTQNDSKKLVFYVAENMECDSVGAFYDNISTLQEAKELFDKLPSDSGRGIGFKMEGLKYNLCNDKVIDADSLYRIEAFKNNKDVQQALRGAIKEFPSAKLIAKDTVKREIEKLLPEK